MGFSKTHMAPDPKLFEVNQMNSHEATPIYTSWGSASPEQTLTACLCSGLLQQPHTDQNELTVASKT